jgi:hypothetical protein
MSKEKHRKSKKQVDGWSDNSSWNSCANLEIKIDSIMNQNYRTQNSNVFPLRRGIEWAQGIEQLNNIKYYNKLPYKVFMQPPLESEQLIPNFKYSISGLTCSSALIKPYTRIVDDFNKLYGQRAFMQYYNIEIDEFNECLEDLYTLIKDYEVTTWDYNNFDIGEEEEEEEEEDE